MQPPSPKYTRTDPLLPDTALCQSHGLVGNGAAVQCGGAAGDRDKGEEGKDSRLDRERAERHLLGAEEAAERNHAAIEDGEKQQRGRDGARGRAFHRRPIVAFVVRGKMARLLTLSLSPKAARPRSTHLLGDPKIFWNPRRVCSGT